MTDNCKHINKVKLARDHSILNPQKWMCYICGTTESVWACLSCSNVACGRYNEEHALKHYEETKHPIALEVNEKYVYCYVCDDYVLNDNPAGDVKLLRSTLSAIATQSFADIGTRGKRILRADVVKEEDRSYTALWHRRLVLLGKTFYAWKSLIPEKEEKKPPLSSKEQKVQTTPSSQKSESPATTPTRKKPTLFPGVCGLRNLGNTCYMNSILQVLGHLETFRDNVLKAGSSGVCPWTTPNKGTPQHRIYMRQTTVECLQHIQTQTPKKDLDNLRHNPRHPRGGLNGGSSSKPGASEVDNTPLTQANSCDTDNQDSVSLCEELHALFRVMWSGKWALVSPHAILNAVWTIIPSFKGYAQQDAQEFLCELLDKVQTEIMNTLPNSVLSDFISEEFQGEIVSEVTCLSCGHQSRTYEPFMELSLDFPDRYHDPQTAAVDTCHITEMLAKFTEVEKLDGEIYACEHCNNKRRKVANKSVILTEAEKRMMVKSLPNILTLHLKRFRWAGRNHREKINIHVDFNEDLDMTPFCIQDQQSSCTYQLSAVVVHHGRGFGSGHYTSYVWNDKTESWHLCNDAKVEFCDNVSHAQAYILFYTRTENLQDDLAKPLAQGIIEEQIDDEITFNFKSCTGSMLQRKRQLEGNDVLHTAKRRRTLSTSW